MLAHMGLDPAIGYPRPIANDIFGACWFQHFWREIGSRSLLRVPNAHLQPS